jgi:hypothetical protein
MSFAVSKMVHIALDVRSVDHQLRVALAGDLGPKNTPKFTLKGKDLCKGCVTKGDWYRIVQPFST